MILGIAVERKRMEKSLKDLFDIAHANAMELMTFEEDKQFLQAQRKEGRSGKMGSLCAVLLK
jgi:hypothetical protein